jgi:hypothetical protein
VGAPARRGRSISGHVRHRAREVVGVSCDRLVGQEIPWIGAALATREAGEAGGASARAERRAVMEEQTVCSIPSQYKGPELRIT